LIRLSKRALFIGTRADLQRALRHRLHRLGQEVRLRRRKVVDPRAIGVYVRSHPVRRLQLGTGPNPLPGWLNTDLSPDQYSEHRGELVYLDATRPFPIAEMSFDYVFSEHQIEHIAEPEARLMLEECFRVLKPSGRIRIATPDLSAILSLRDDPLEEVQRHYVDWVMTRFRPDIASGNRRCYVINHIFKDHGHQFIYDYETLLALLTDAGFGKVARRKPGESDDPVLRGIEAHGRAIGDEAINHFETLVVEAQRPT
jgi:predicted SAM-dependent methyltransferase